jgi:hypothetical protein
MMGNEPKACKRTSGSNHWLQCPPGKVMGDRGLNRPWSKGALLSQQLLMPIARKVPSGTGGKCREGRTAAY